MPGVFLRLQFSWKTSVEMAESFLRTRLIKNILPMLNPDCFYFVKPARAGMWT